MSHSFYLLTSPYRQLHWAQDCCRYVFLSVLTLATSAIAVTENVQTKSADHLLSKHVYTASNGMTLPYRLYLPKNTSQKTPLPLLIFLHGRGERGTDNNANMFNNVGLFKGEHSILSHKNRQQFPTAILIPQCSDKTPHEEWARWKGNSAEQPFAGLGADGSYQQHAQPSASSAATLELIDLLIAQKRLDPQRIYLTGISMGGFGTWELTSRRPELFAAAVPMAGFSDPSKAALINTIPFWVFHGTTDQYNPVEGSRVMTQKMKALGAAITYTEYEGLGHGETFEKAWQNTHILPWIFAQKKALSPQQ
ncbi:carboxylesterase family protein [Teredinibacter purpureus]|uniref:carboxylesterase family protein n=1 Tax=Teredinibacter purpureus TaxID=2731756 RepID=UPI0006990C64|nr:alpha/beta hydrolase-fold protein [Teredinibacter purpureus]